MGWNDDYEVRNRHYEQTREEKRRKEERKQQERDKKDQEWCKNHLYNTKPAYQGSTISREELTFSLQGISKEDNSGISIGLKESILNVSLKVKVIKGDEYQFFVIKKYNYIKILTKLDWKSGLYSCPSVFSVPMIPLKIKGQEVLDQKSSCMVPKCMELKYNKKGKLEEISLANKPIFQNSEAPGLMIDSENRLCIMPINERSYKKLERECGVGKIVADINNNLPNNLRPQLKECYITHITREDYNNIHRGQVEVYKKGDWEIEISGSNESENSCCIC